LQSSHRIDGPSKATDRPASGSASGPVKAAAPTAAPAGVPLLDVRREFEPLRREILAAIEAVCASGQFILGPEVTRLEQRLAEYCGTKHAVGCASGSDALLLALMANEIGPGDEVILPSYTFFATASAVTRLGAKPVFADIEPEHFTIDPADIEPRITPGTRAIIPVHLYGQCADMDVILAIAKRHKLRVIEDACQAIGAEHRGRRAGSMGDIGCFSFYPTKNLGGFGDGGLLTTSDDTLAERLRLLRSHGMQPRYYHQVVGMNSRLDSLQAAVLNVKLSHLEHWTAQRQANAQRYRELLAAHGLDKLLGLPSAAPDRRHVWNQYVIRVPAQRRDALRKHLGDHQIGTEIYYPVPLHQQVCFRKLGLGGEQLVETERAAGETLALPIHQGLTSNEQELVVNPIGEFFAACQSHRPYISQQATSSRST
jgi:dTDP-4-amino-4,6-dideoxygalactose transaminase